MTFLEAAIEILKHEQQPLHYKKLTQLAVERNLLTVIGRTPELTMQQRLNDALKKQDPSLLLTRERPGVFGLRHYPPLDEAPAQEAAPPVAQEVEQPAAAPAAAPALSPPSRPTDQELGAEGEEKRRRRRRGGRGRRRADEGQLPDAAAIARRRLNHEEGAAASERAATPVPSAVAQAGETEAAEPAQLPLPATVEPRAAESPTGDDQRSGANAAQPETADVGLAPAPPADLATSAAEEAPPPVEEPPSRVEAMPKPPTARPPAAPATASRPSAPAAMPLPPRSPAPRAQQHAAVVAPAPGESSRLEAKGSAPPRPNQDARPTETAAGRRPTVVDAVIDVLRSGDGRPLHIRQIVDIAIKRKLIRGNPPELWRSIGIALLADQRARESTGLRARVQTTGGGHFVLVERRLDGELLEKERALAAAASRLSEASRSQLRRRIARLTPPAFEGIIRLLLERMNVSEIEPVRRGEGVVYFGGLRARDGDRQRLLIGLRPGEGELGRVAIGELRAGIKARNAHAGMIFTAGRAANDTLAEASAGGPIEIYDGSALVEACTLFGLGIVRRTLPVELLDIDLLSEFET